MPTTPRAKPRRWRTALRATLGAALLAAAGAAPLPAAAQAVTGVEFIAAGCTQNLYWLCGEPMFDVAFPGTGGFGTGGYSSFIGGFGVQADAYAAAAANPGQSLGVYAGMRGSIAYYAGTTAMTIAVSRFSDTLTISHPQLNGHTAWLQLAMRVDGTARVQHDARAEVAALIDASLYPVGSSLAAGLMYRSADGYAVGDGAFVIPALPLGLVPFTFGQPFDLGIELEAMVLARFTGNERGHGQFDLLLDALHTAQIGAITIDGGSGPLTEWSLISASGHDYAPVAVPEPASALLWPLGLALLAWQLRRCRPGGSRQGAAVAHATAGPG